MPTRVDDAHFKSERAEKVLRLSVSTRSRVDDAHFKSDRAEKVLRLSVSTRSRVDGAHLQSERAGKSFAAQCQRPPLHRRRPTSK